jgi:hypothetical protein
MISLLYGSLLFGAIGQSLVFHDSGYPSKLLLMFCMVPFFVVFALTFCNAPPPIKPRTYRGILVVVFVWFALLTIAAEVLFFFSGPAAVRVSQPGVIVSHSLMYFGLISGYPLKRIHSIIREVNIDLKAEPSAGGNAAPPRASA